MDCFYDDQDPDGGFGKKRKRFSVEQIVGILKQAEVWVPVAEVIRKAGIAEQTFYRRNKQYLGLVVDRCDRSSNYRKRAAGLNNWSRN
jgi:hypothetical protein